MLKVMEYMEETPETAYEFLLRKGIRKIHQPNKRYNLTISELVEFLNEFAESTVSGMESGSYAEHSAKYHYRYRSDFAI